MSVRNKAKMVRLKQTVLSLRHPSFKGADLWNKTESRPNIIEDGKGISMLCLKKSKLEDANHETICGLSAGRYNSNGQGQWQRLAGPMTRNKGMSSFYKPGICD